jgi:hypothetical protein
MCWDEAGWRAGPVAPDAAWTQFAEGRLPACGRFELLSAGVPCCNPSLGLAIADSVLGGWDKLRAWAKAPLLRG